MKQTSSTLKFKGGKPVITVNTKTTSAKKLAPSMNGRKVNVKAVATVVKGAIKKSPLIHPKVKGAVTKANTTTKGMTPKEKMLHTVKQLAPRMTQGNKTTLPKEHSPKSFKAPTIKKASNAPVCKNCGKKNCSC